MQKLNRSCIPASCVMNVDKYNTIYIFDCGANV